MKVRPLISLRYVVAFTTILAVLSGEVRAQKRTFTLRILTYNIYHGEATDGSIDMDLFASIINEVKPDLVALQEVDKNAQRTGVIDITSELSKRTGLPGYFVKHRDFQGGEYGNAILSRFPVTGIDVIDGYKSGESGITIPFAHVKLADDAQLIFNCTHLSTRLEDRKAQAQQLLDYYAQNHRAPMIITGDLNAEPHHEEIKMLLEHFSEADTSYQYTFSSRSTPSKKIDYILHPRSEQWKVLERRVLWRGDASDHCAVFAVLQWNPRFEVDTPRQ